MERYIHVGTLIDHIDWDNDIQKWTLRREPEDIPASDVEEVKYANWIFEVDWAGNGGTSCSGCHWASPKNDSDTIRYGRCPNCGAHMLNAIKMKF